MNNNLDNYIKILLTSFIHNSTPDLPNDINYSKLYAISKQQHIDGTLGYVISQHNLCPDTYIASQFLNSYLSSVIVSTNQINCFEKLINHFKLRSIDIIAFKGYSVRSLYPVPELRSFSDIDLFIKSEDRSKSHQLMLDLKYKCPVDYGSVYSYKKGIEYYELHETLIGEDILQSDALIRYFNNAWKYTHKTSDHFYEFDDEFHLIYLIAHIAKHIHFGGAGIRMYLDIALFIKQKGTYFNFKSLLDTAKTLGFDKFVCTVISAACSWFSLETPMIVKNTHKINEDTLEQLFCFTMDKGIFGNAMTSSGEATVQIMKQSGKKHPKLSALLTFAFPPLSIMKLKHTYLKKAPILLPFAWVQRAFLNTGKIKSKKQKVKDIVSTNKASIEKQSQLLSDIGL